MVGAESCVPGAPEPEIPISMYFLSLLLDLFLFDDDGMYISLTFLE